MDSQRFVPGDPILIENIVSYLKAKGIFDEFRHECLADVDTKSSCQNLSQRVDGYTTKFLSNETWNPDLNKNELRNKLRRHIDESGMLAVGADHVVEQVIYPKIGQLFLPSIIEVVHQYLKEENDKLNKKQELANESTSFEKSTEYTDGSSYKTRTPVLDPIADILSFTYSKPKPVPQNAILKPEAAYKKGSDVPLKIEKRKDDGNSQIKNADILPKVEKKEEETVVTKNTDLTVKTERKDDNQQTKFSDVIIKTEKTDEDVVDKLEVNESSSDSTVLPTKSQVETKEIIKMKKEVKTEQTESQTEVAKKISKDESKLDKKKVESDESASTDDKSTVVATKSSSLNKSKHDLNKSKKQKTHNTQKTSGNASDRHKLKNKESSDHKTPDKHSKSSTKLPKQSSKDQSAPLKTSTSKTKEKSEDDSVKIKSDHHSTKVSSKKSSSNSGSIKKEHTSTKSKQSSDNHDPQKSSKRSKPEYFSQSSSNSTEKEKTSSQYSSSYESSQGSDQDKSSQTSDDTLKKQKHYSKHYNKENPKEKTIIKSQKNPPDQKRSHKDSDHSATKKHRGEKSSKITFKEKLKETTLAQDSAKISSRSNSFGSASSTSDSSNVNKESVPSSSEDASESSSKNSEKRRTAGREHCNSPHDFPHPPPPPPPSDSVAVDTTSSSQEEFTQSSQESESEADSSDESSNHSGSSNSSASQTSDHNSVLESSDLNDVYDILLYSSSSSDFEGFCSSPERNREKSCESDVSVSSVHTSDLSSFEDEISAEDLSSEDYPLSENQNAKKKLTLKEAQDLLRRKKEQQRSEVAKNIPYEGTLEEEKSSEILFQSPTLIISSEEEVSPQPEPRRELRRERKLNPKYASSEYTSIFNSKRTSFITKQMNLSPQKQILNTSSTATQNSTSEICTTSPKVPNITTKKEEKTKEKASKAVTTNQNEYPDSIEVVLNNINPADESDYKEFGSTSGTEDDLSPVEINSNDSTADEPKIMLSINMKNSSVKTKNNIPKEINPNGLKRKLEGSENTPNKRLCNRNSIDSSSVSNENTPFNNEKIDKSVLSSSESQNILPKPKANGDILGKMDRLRKSSFSKPNRTSDKK